MSTYNLDGRDLRELVKQVKNGDVIVLYEGPYDQFEPDLFGVIIRIGNMFLRNGDRLICQCECNGWFPDLMGSVIMKIDNPSVNCPDVESEPTTSKLMRNGLTLIYEGVITSCAPNLAGIVIKQEDDFSILSWAGNMVHVCNSRSHDWRADETGVIVRIDDKFYHNGEFSEKDSNGNVHENTDGILYNGPWSNWDSGFSKLVVRNGYKFLRNGARLICESDFDADRAHPYGVLLVLDNKFSLVVFKDDESNIVSNTICALVTEVMGEDSDDPATERENPRQYFPGRRPSW